MIGALGKALKRSIAGTGACGKRNFKDGNRRPVNAKGVEIASRAESEAGSSGMAATSATASRTKLEFPGRASTKLTNTTGNGEREKERDRRGKKKPLGKTVGVEACEDDVHVSVTGLPRNPDRTRPILSSPVSQRRLF